MAANTVICAACGKAYQVEQGQLRSFCVHCGAPQALQAAPLPDEGLARKQALETLAASADADPAMRDALTLWPARFTVLGRKGERVADEFIRLYSMLPVYGREASTAHGRAQVQKLVEGFFGRKQLKDALGMLKQPEHALFQELLDAACLYMRICLNDRRYGSTMLELVRLKPQDIHKKLAGDVADRMLAPLLMLQQSKYIQLLLSALQHAYQRECAQQQALLQARIDEMAEDAKLKLRAALDAWTA